MNYLALNTAGSNLEILLSANGKHFYFSDTDGKRASVILLSKIDEMLDEAGVTLRDMDFFACVIGPGSFTGIRIGVTTVRNFCYALKKKAIGVNYLSLLAYNMSADNSESIISILDGSNGTAYLATYDNKHNELLKPCVLAQSELKDFLSTVDESFSVCCDKSIAAMLKAENLLKIPYLIPDESAFRRAVEANFYNQIDYNLIEPLYIRVSQAEKELAEKESKALKNCEKL